MAAVLHAAFRCEVRTHGTCIVVHVALYYHDLHRWCVTFREFTAKGRNHTALRAEFDSVPEDPKLVEDLHTAVVGKWYVVKAVRDRRWHSEPFREPQTRDVFWLPFLTPRVWSARSPVRINDCHQTTTFFWDDFDFPISKPKRSIASAPSTHIRDFPREWVRLPRVDVVVVVVLIGAALRCVLKFVHRFKVLCASALAGKAARARRALELALRLEVRVPAVLLSRRATTERLAAVATRGGHTHW